MHDPRRHPACTTFLAVSLTFLLACSEDANGPTDPGSSTPPASVDAYMNTLPDTWADYAPLEPTSNAVAGAATTTEQTVQEPGPGGIVQPVIYACTETPYSLTDTPAEIAMYQPNANIMWLGNLIQGASYKGGSGSFEELTITERDTLTISIDLLTQDNVAVIPRPTLGSVQSAVGGLIERAADRGHKTGSSISWEENITYSVEQAALQLGLSARYLGGKAKTDLSTSRVANEKTYTAHFVQRMFTIAIELPASAGDFFTDDFTQAKLEKLISDGYIGPNNPPVYIASISYGRILTYSLTSTHSEHRIKAAISASYNGVAGGASGYTEAELLETLDQQNVRVATIGGDAQNVLNLIATGNLKAYFTSDEPVSLTTARPISYQLNYLGDNRTAEVSETSSYTLTECSPKAAAGGRFDFPSIQEGSSPVPTPYSVTTGDFNGDGRGDLLWNHLVSGSNRIAVGFGMTDGTFDIRTAVTHDMTPPEGWGNGYTMHVGDFNADGLDDLMWNRVRGGGANRVYIAISNGDGTFAFRTPTTHPNEPAWIDGWRTHVGDLNGDGRSDIIWNLLGQSNYTFTARAVTDSTFAYSGRMTHPSQGFQPYVAYIGDVDGDGDDDITWNKTPSDNWIHFGRSNGNGTLTLSMSAQSIGSAAGWQSYVTNTGDVNRDGRMDMVWTVHDAAFILHRALGETNGRFRHLQYSSHDPLDLQGTLETLMGDFNGDGGDDLLFIDIGVGRNHMTIAQGNVDGGFDFTPTPQEHPASAGSEDWTAFRGGILVLDVNGDCRDDVVWNERSVTNRIYVALARGQGSCAAPGMMSGRSALRW
ncbi:MAG TPA: thiol-activated cytolysin family protein [Longimicrobiales bacterium]|nr:thiol-activated cytolysin family protein [Longimicrobiales bacterium]